MVHSQDWSIQQSEVQVKNCWWFRSGASSQEKGTVCNRSFNTLFALSVKSVGLRRSRQLGQVPAEKPNYNKRTGGSLSLLERDNLG